MTRPVKRPLSPEAGRGSVDGESKLSELKAQRAEDSGAPVPVADSSVPRSPSTAAIRRLTLLSWNTSNAQQSCRSPPGWGRPQQEKGIADAVLALRPDVVCLQEVERPPYLLVKLLGAAYSGPHGWVPSHMGHCCTWIRNASGLEVVGAAVSCGPASLLRLRGGAVASVGGLVVANCHLEPFKDGADVRAVQLASIQDTALRMLTEAEHERGVAAIAGDMNMRVAEDVVAKALGLTDCWEAAGSSRANKFTWDSRRNLYYPDGFQYVSRYDRVYFSGGEHSVLKCADFQLVGNEPAAPDRIQGHYLSDHFGIMATLEFP